MKNVYGYHYITPAMFSTARKVVGSIQREFSEWYVETLSTYDNKVLVADVPTRRLITLLNTRVELTPSEHTEYVHVFKAPVR